MLEKVKNVIRWYPIFCEFEQSRREVTYLESDLDGIFTRKYYALERRNRVNES